MEPDQTETRKCQQHSIETGREVRALEGAIWVFFFSAYFLHRKLGRRGVSLSGSGVQRAKSSQLLQPAFTLRMNHSLGSSRHTGTAWWSIGANFTSGKHDETLFVFFCRERIRLVLQHVSMQKRSTLFELVHSLSETTNVTKSEIIFFPVRRSLRGKLGFITHLTNIKLSVHMMFFWSTLRLELFEIDWYSVVYS